MRGNVANTGKTGRTGKTRKRPTPRETTEGQAVGSGSARDERVQSDAGAQGRRDVGVGEREPAPISAW